MGLQKGTAKPEKIVNISQCHHLSPRKMLCDELQDSEYPDLDSMSVWMKQIFNESEA